jgi:Rod binding domain-containing protein
MNLGELNALKMRPTDANQKERARAEQTAAQFEQMFVRTLVSSLRSTASVGGDGAMFGSGPGADTFADWFDQNLAEQIGKTSDIGIASALLADLERNHELTPQQAAQARTAADRNPFLATKAATKGGFDVVL